ncbi:MAG: hypothetical protein ICV83_00975 [Cytophagales bacterium]|nr:hypothetical protein [Cytophagales bacterium]
MSLAANAQDRVGTFTVQQWAGPALRAVGAGAHTSINLGRDNAGRPVAGYTGNFDDLEIAVASGTGNYASEAVAGDVIMRMPAEGSKMLFKLGLNNVTGFTLTGQRVGVGTAFPVSRLDVGNVVLADPTRDVPTITLWNNGSVYYGLGVSGGTLNAFAHNAHSFYTLPTEGQPRKRVCFMESNGMGIGVTSLPAGYSGMQLAVNGRITAKEVKVTVTGLGDYVFSPAYRLRPLAEVEVFVKENGHLPEVPSAAEVARDGMNVGEMENTLLKKVEELTLYVIELKKENEQQARQIELLQSNKKR